tara:strand:+ start:62 stop:583 length:522 start_codon:yes stop_codon:yes gene_type:complete
MKSFILFLSIVVCFLGSCSEIPVDEYTPQAVLPSDIMSPKKWAPPISVKAARQEAIPGKILTVEGFIGGRKNPFTRSKAVFILGDDALKTCDEIPGDSCPTPWDVCCEDRKKVATSTLSVQILDENGSLLSGTLNGVAGIEAGKRVKVQGTVSESSTSESLALEVSALEILND